MEPRYTKEGLYFFFVFEGRVPKLDCLFMHLCEANPSMRQMMSQEFNIAAYLFVFLCVCMEPMLFQQVQDVGHMYYILLVVGRVDENIIHIDCYEFLCSLHHMMHYSLERRRGIH